MGERDAAALPLALHRPQLIPPAPGRDPRALAFLADLRGFSWIAYGAHSLLVISHLPSPSRSSSSLFFRQVVDLRAPVAAAAWCRGELAAAAANSVSIFRPASSPSPGTFSWHLEWVIAETFAISAIAWTGSGDGLVAVGTEVALWAKAQSSWQLAWRYTQQVPQSLVCATHFARGPVATAAAAPTEDEAPVLVYMNDGKSGVVKAKLTHPCPVLMIQWRPSASSIRDPSDVRREILMTCCLDGTVRLWCENGGSRSKKQLDSWRYFSVIAVIEINNTLKGALGVDVTVRWAIENGSVVSRGEGGKFELFSGDSGQSQVGKCEWLISVGPGPCVNFWALHCLDDVSPARYPRVTRWKESKLLDREESGIKVGFRKSEEQPILVEAIISRTLCSGPPTTCSLLHLLPDNSFIWSRLSSSPSSDGCSQVSSDSTKSISCGSTIIINQDGHEGSIRQVSIHPYSCEMELAVSLDSTGMLLFWSLSTFSTFIPCLHAPIYPLWKLLGKFDLRCISTDSQYSCLSWAPSAVHNKRFLILGGENGLDCYVVGIPKEGEAVLCRKMLAIPFLGRGKMQGPPDSIHTLPLSSNCEEYFFINSFLVFCIWKKSFQALSWKVVLHSENQCEGSCPCGFAASSVSLLENGGHVSFSKGEMYSAVIYSGSSVFPASLDRESPTCISVMPLNNAALPIQQREPSRITPGYHIATGCSNGTVKLWRMLCADDAALETEAEFISWELVGTFHSHQGPVSAVSLCSSGRIATVSRSVQTNSTFLHIWEAVNLMGSGSFLLEDALVLEGPVVGLDWLSLSNGQFLLRVCLPNELHIYSHKRPSSENVVHTENSKEKHFWSCLALAHSHHRIEGFLWAPKATTVLVHKKHLSLFSPWLVKHGGGDEYGTQKCASAADVTEELPCARYFRETAFDKFRSSENFRNREAGDTYSFLCLNQHHSPYSVSGLCNLLDVTDKLSGPLASYHPRALIQYLYSGKWKRANAVLQNLIQSLKVSETSKIMKCNSCGKSFPSIPELPLSEYFMDTTSNNNSNKGPLWGENRSSTAFSLLSSTNSFPYMEHNLGINASTNASQRSEIIQLLEKNFDISAINDIERTQILAIADLLGEITDQSSSSPYKSLDEAGRRFWVAVQFQHLYSLRISGDSSSPEGRHIDSASIAWAFQSDCQDDLLNSILPAESTWSAIKNLGIGLWYNNVPQLRTRMEKLARLQYLKRKDPKDCALLYIALNRIQVLVGLFKISRDEKDKRLYEFLSRNFEDEKHKAAALKNAYVLMGRHQWELAIAFFLLGGDSSSAVTVCAKNLRDEQLALVICRLAQGYGGSLERNLICTVLLPDAVEKGDYWLSSLLEWMLGNYSQSVEKLFGCHIKSLTEESSTFCNQNVLSDPEVGQYCASVAVKNSFRNSVGEALSATLSKLSFGIAASALNRYGLPLEALEYLSCNSSDDGKDSRISLYSGDHNIFRGILSSSTSCNWLSASVVSNIELNFKVTMASKCLSRLLRGHPPCSQCNLPLTREMTILKEYNDHQIGELACNVKTAMSLFEQRFSLKFDDLAEKLLTFSNNDGLLFLGYVLLWGNRSQNSETDNHGLEVCTLYPISNLLLEAYKESCSFLARYVVLCSFMYFVPNLDYTNTSASTFKEDRRDDISSLSTFLRISRLLLNHNSRGTSALNNTSAILAVLDLLEYTIEFALSWLGHDIRALIIMINPVLGDSVNGQSFQTVLHRLMQALHHKSHGTYPKTMERMSNGSPPERKPEKSEEPTLSIDEKWHLIGASLWIRLTSFIKLCLSEFDEKERLEGEHSACDVEFKGLISSVAARFVAESLDFVSSSLVKLLASFLRENMENLHSSAPVWLEYKSSLPRSINASHDQQFSILQLPNNEDMELFNILWEISASPLDVCTAFANEEVNCFPLNSLSLSRSWKDVGGITVEYESGATQRSGEENKHNVISKNNEVGQGFVGGASSDVESYLESKRKGLIVHKVDTYFQSPRELLKRNGELLEAICPNSIDEQQIAIATNRKGLIFFNWNDKQHNKKLAEYVWSESDWPLDGWAGCESTPTPTFVLPGISLGSKRGTHLGLGGATIGSGSSAKPGRDLTGGGAFGIPGYAGIGASGFGWGVTEEFEEFVDPPATLENIHSRALSCHPSLPLFLVGSSNTHVYLWEFGKDSAAATYGVLPAANIPPPYAVASISAVQFDHYGQRFTTAALDGTVCTWQLEVGGRSNIHSTESSLCFSSHASDVAYVSASGSVVAAAGYSSTGANVVIWDTLAPPASCQTYLTCHEGGARSLSVFDNDVGSSSISPVIVTCGKSGDVALHDVRFIATGKVKHQKNSNEQNVKASSMHDTKSGTSIGGSAPGVIWYIPKAHLGSVTTVSTIPHTSLFLTGSKDGDVKLWDAKNSRLVFHWQKLHDRHTFFQPNSRGFGGVVRAAVTDIQVLSNGFITCGGDGSVKFIQIK